MNKYIPPIKGTRVKGDGKPGRYSEPNKWVTGPDIQQREKYYAWLKHRAQAQFRKETYLLTWDDWQSLWPNELFEQRGRRNTDLCLSRKDYRKAWELNNCMVCSRVEHFKNKVRINNDRS